MYVYRTFNIAQFKRTVNGFLIKIKRTVPLFCCYIGGIYPAQPGGVMPQTEIFIKRPLFSTEKKLKKDHFVRKIYVDIVRLVC